MSVFDTWKGTIEINGSQHTSIDDVRGAVSIHLIPNGFVKPEEEAKPYVMPVDEDTVYVVKVKTWMTKPSTPEFNFMEKFNKDTPMPLRVMVGKVIKESPKMIYMQLHGDILQEVTQTCMCCGKPITNEVSKYFGMGPVCGHHNYVNPFSSREELKQAVADYRERLHNVTWEGWIPRSAIEEMKIYE